MAKFLSRFFSTSGSSSSKRSSFRSSQTSINDTNHRTGAQTNMRGAASLENLSSYHINPKELEKNKLHKASWEGNINKVERLARPGQIDLKDQHSRTALHLAIVRGHLDIVKYLVHEGAKLDVIDQEHRTPLVKAVLSGNKNPAVNYQICAVLLGGGADAFINAVDNHGKNALHYAIDFSNEHLVDLFLSYPNCDPNFKDREQMTPLHLAVRRNSPNIVHILLSDQLEIPADPNITDRNGQTSLHMAASVGYADIIRIILQSHLDEPCDPTMIDSQQLTAYQLAKANHQDLCAKLIEEYQQGWTKLAPHRQTSVSINEGQMNPAGNLSHEESGETSDSEESQTSSGPIKRQTNQWPDRAIPPATVPKQETKSLADLIKHNPLHSEITQTNASKPVNVTLTTLIHSGPLQPGNQTSGAPSKPDEKLSDKPKNIKSQQTRPPYTSAVGHALQDGDTDDSSTSSSNEKSLSPQKNLTTNALVNKLIHPDEKLTGPQQTRPPYTSGIGPALQHRETDNTSIEKPLIVGPVSLPQKNLTANALVNTLIKPDDRLTNKPVTSQQTRPPPSIFGIGPALQQRETDNTSIEKGLIGTNLIAGPASSPKKNVVANSLVNKSIHPDLNASNSNSWTHDSLTNRPHDQTIKQAKKIETWDSSSGTQSDDEDDRTGVYRTKTASTNFSKPQSFSPLNGTAMFTTTPTNDNLNDSKSEEDSIEAAIQKMNTQKPSLGIQNVVNQQLGNNYKVTQPATMPAIQSPISEQSSWSTSSLTGTKDPGTKGISSLVQQQPLLIKKISGSTWDDSRPLSADLKRSIVNSKTRTSSSSDDSYDDQDKKSATIVKSPLTSGATSNLVNAHIRPTALTETKTTGGIASNLVNPHIRPTDLTGTKTTIGVASNLVNAHIRPTALTETKTTGGIASSLVNANVRPTDWTETKTTGGIASSLVNTHIRPTDLTEIKTTGVENLAKIIHTIMNTPHHEKQPTSPKTIGRLIVTPLIKRTDSLSSNASSIIDDTVRTSIMTERTTATLKQQIYRDGGNDEDWPTITNDGHDLKRLTRKYSNEMIHPSQQQSSRTSIHHDFNNLRGSMSSSTSSIQNNMERISELKEDIKQIERKQEDSFELRRQLKEMENKKNNFEALYKKNDQLLRETETKLEKEINEKQRLEWTTKNLNMELKSVRQKLESLEDEKHILNQRCQKLKEERDNYDEKLRVHHTNNLQSSAATVLREEDIEKIKLRHREEMKLLSAENDDLHQRTRQLQSDLQLHKESLDVTIRYKIDLEKALEEKTFLQHELDRLKHEKDFIEQEKVDYKIKYDNLQDEIRVILFDRSKLEQKFTNDLQEQMKHRQRSTDDIKKYKTQIEHLNIKLGDAEARLLVLRTQNEALVVSKDRGMKNEFDTLTQRLNMIESEKANAEQRYHNEHKEITNKQQHVSHEPLVILTSTPLSNAMQQQHQHSPSSSCVKCNTLQRSYEQEHEYRLQTEKDNERLRDVVSRQKQQQHQQQENEHYLAENSKQIRSETDRVKSELDRLRHDFDKLVINYEPSNNLQQQAQLHAQIDTLRQFYEQEFRQKQLVMSQVPNGIHPTTTNVYHRASPPMKHHDYDHALNGSLNCSTCSNSRLLKERLESAIDTSLADQRIQTIKQLPNLPRQKTPSLPTNNDSMSSVDLLRKRYYL